jgi:uncharacterized phage protein (TIGR02216 family)|tara:strand:- start:245 stop:376 length:132 start_codon:yes stop_codon:yes gene_type:complete
VFWGLTPREFLSALTGFNLTRGGKNNTPVDRSEMENLMRRFPD